MFGKLRDKIKSWMKKVSEEEKQAERLKDTSSKGGGEDGGGKEQEKYIKVPEKFNVGTQKYEPDLEELEKTVEELIEEVKENKKDKLKKEKKGLFRKISLNKIKISEKKFEIYEEELKMLLLENNVAYEVTEKMIHELKEKIVGKELLKREVEEEIKDCFKDIIEKILIEPFDIIKKIKEKKKNSKEPFVILFCGINGSGKTTTIAKIAEYLKKNNISSIFAASDTFRAASIEQLQKHGNRLNVKVISHDYGSDPAAVGFDAIKYAKKKFIDCVLIDTAGRMHTAKNLLREIEKISKVTKPDLKIFVGESITGNDAVEQAKSFDWSIGIDGIILTKADIDEKGGTSLSVGYVTKKPILFLGTGQEYDAIEPFNKKKFIEKLGL